MQTQYASECISLCLSIYVYPYLINIYLRECVLTTVILAPGGSEVGLGVAAPGRDTALRGMSSARSLFMREAPQTLQILTEKDVHFDPKSAKLPLASQGAPKGPTGIPREPNGSQNEAKESPLGAQGATKSYKGGPKSSRGKKNELQKDTQRRPTNH